jgi:hypothetical protein
MKPYFEKMTDFGQELKAGLINSTEPKIGLLKDVEEHVDEAVEKVKMPDCPRKKSAPVGS